MRGSIIRLPLNMNMTKSLKQLDIRIYDIPTIFYVSFWLVLLIFFSGHFEKQLFFIGLHLYILAIIFLWALKPPKLLISRFFRKMYPGLHVPLLFTALTFLIPAFNSRSFDFNLIQMDYWLFGVHPTVWIQKWYHPLLTEYLQWNYLIYYFLSFVVVLALYLRKKYERIDELLTILTTGFYLFYLGYLIFPALGPRFFLAHLHTEPLTGVWMADNINNILNSLENIQFDAFPSGHAANIFILLYYSWKHLRKFFWVILPFCVSLLISTVYLRYHYVVDLAAGFIVAVLTYVIVYYLTKWFYYKPHFENGTVED